jgi:hypothetical protein
LQQADINERKKKWKIELTGGKELSRPFSVNNSSESEIPDILLFSWVGHPPPRVLIMSTPCRGHVGPLPVSGTPKSWLRFDRPLPSSGGEKV